MEIYSMKKIMEGEKIYNGYDVIKKITEIISGDWDFIEWKKKDGFYKMSYDLENQLFREIIDGKIRYQYYDMYTGSSEFFSDLKTTEKIKSNGKILEIKILGDKITTEIL